MQLSSTRIAIFPILIGLTIGLMLGFVEDKAQGAECTPIYGGGEVCPEVRIDINKRVANPATGELRENLFETDPKYRVDNIVTFEIIVTNTGQTTLNEVVVKDILPPQLRFHSGPGKIEGNTLTIETSDLSAGESRSFVVRGIVNDTSSGTFCNITNRVEVKAKENGNELSDVDNSQFCIQKDVLGATVPQPVATKLPAAGPASILLFTSTLATTGLLLRKYSI